MLRGSLFTRYFLDDGIREMAQYRSLAAGEVEAFAAAARRHWAYLEQFPRPSEAETEAELVFPLLDRLGWERLPQQEPGRGRHDIADALLFIDQGAKERARPLPSAERFRLGAVVVENEARDTLLDRGSAAHEAPSTQILRYLGRAEAQSGGAVRWGLLANGRFWRLYWAQARARAEGFVEIELPALFGDLPPPVPDGADPQHWLRVFMLLFGRSALVPEGARGETFLDLALAEGQRYEQRITEALSRVVFQNVYPELVRAIGRADPDPRPDDPAWRTEVRNASLRLLYRLLFLLYAEDRDLLPVRHDGYRQYGLQPMRDEAAEIVDGRRAVSDRRTIWWPRLTNLFAAIASGDREMGLPPYNGGLFDEREAPLLAHIELPDRTLAGLIDALSREAGSKRWINYRDLSVQHLGSIYERLLEREVARSEAGDLTLRPSVFARKTTGSYYTPDELVRLILRRAIRPLLDERRRHFADRAAALGADRRPKPERLRQLEELDPAEAFVRLRVCDPAMGSGHFLVSLVDYLADEVLTAIGDAPNLVSWADADRPYRSPLAGRIERLRSEIRQSADSNGWPVPDEQLDDRHLVRRIILKRVVYGVDLNPMAVELAKLSLWLHSFTVGAPLSFLDHHLRCGDSLFGELVGPVERELQQRYGLVLSPDVAQARQAAAGMARVEELADADIGEVRSSREAFAGVEETTSALRAFLDLTHAARWLPPAGDAAELARELLFGGNYGNPVRVAAGDPLVPLRGSGTELRRRGKRFDPAEVQAAASAFVANARALAVERRFLHWEAAFPGVWSDWSSAAPPGGFDAVIGNPPWDRMKLQEVEWFAARVPAIAHAQRAADRKRMVEGLRRRNDPVAADYDHAARTAEAAARVARTNGAYPLLSGGDVNVYSLFVERALRLVCRDGIAGLLVPSGIAADKGAAEFFRSISTTGRLAALLDFENRRTALGLDPFFPDADSRFKFSAFVAGGPARTFAHADCAFFKQDAVAAEAEAFPLAPSDFAAVNPNTGTAPVFRSLHDAEITLGIYRRLPVLVDRRGDEPVSVWPVRYFTMFHMTNDSDKFRTAAELERLGAYRVAGQRWEKGEERWLPLYEGKMVQAYDHRAASVVVNSRNLNRPAQPSPTSDTEHANPGQSPTPQFWVSAEDISTPVSETNCGTPPSPSRRRPGPISTVDTGLRRHGLAEVRGASDAIDDPLAVLAFKDVTSPTNLRTMIAAFVPATALGNTLPAILPDVPSSAATYSSNAPLWLGNLNSLILDYVARQKVQGQHLNWFIVEQLPVVPPDAYARHFGPKTAAEIVREDVLHLTYTAHDMAGFARDQGYDGPPFRWDEEDRIRRRARLDALYFHLYGLDRGDADYVLSTFPIVRREEEARWGRFRSRELVLGFMAALAAGAPDAAIAG